MDFPPSKLFSTIHELLIAQYDINRWHWQQSTPPFDICLGAILVQHTAWTNVEKALANLRAAGVWSLEAIQALAEDEIALLVRPVGTPLTKASRLQAFAALARDAGGLEALLQRPAGELRLLLLSTPGIGPETADAILLYAARAPVVVHDAYTERLCRRIGIGPEGNRYADWRTWLDAQLPPDGDLRRANHAAIVLHCKETCRVRPQCDVCPLAGLCAYGQGLTASLG
jgi:endonuclease-3 related protein